MQENDKKLFFKRVILCFTTYLNHTIEIVLFLAEIILTSERIYPVYLRYQKKEIRKIHLFHLTKT